VRTSSLLAFAIALIGCVAEPPPALDERAAASVRIEIDEPDDDEPPPPLDVDLCDDPTYPGVAWVSATSAHFHIHYLPGTAAERDREAILNRLEKAYTEIRARLGVTATPTISVHLSPNRVAAVAHGRAMGRAWPGEDRYEVLYTGAPDSYEVLRHGHELTHVLEYHLDPARPRRHAFLSEGLAEYLDQSGRDLHDAYALQLIAGAETRVRTTSFDSRDVTGKNYGRAGSLVQLLVERHGMDAFLNVFGSTAVTFTGGCWRHATYGCIATPEALVAMLDGVLAAVTGERWATVAAAWEADVQAALMAAEPSLPDADVAEITALLATMDHAVTTGEPDLYRKTMEGFYCDWGGEAMRTEIAARAVEAFVATRSEPLAILDTGVKNFRTALVVVMRQDERRRKFSYALTVEHVPEGWRVAYGPDWY
jgi:hypothetical protein